MNEVKLGIDYIELKSEYNSDLVLNVNHIMTEFSQENLIES